MPQGGEQIQPPKHYTLEGHVPVPCDEETFREESSYWLYHPIAEAHRRGIQVLTCFRGIDLNWSLDGRSYKGGAPLVFQTIVSREVCDGPTQGGEIRSYHINYSTWGEAISGHRLLCITVWPFLRGTDQPYKATFK